MLAEPVLDSVVRLFGANSQALMGNAIGITLPLFVLLVGLQWAWDLIMWVLLDDEHFVGKALRRFLLHSFFYLLIVALPLWLPQILGGFERLGQEVTGLGGLSPSSLFFQGVSLAFSLYASWKAILITLFIPFAGTLQAVTFFCVLIAFTVMAFQLGRVLVEAAVVLGGMVVFLAMSAHKMTFGLFEGYVRYLVDVGIRVYVVYLLVFVGQNLGMEWDAMVRDATAFELADPRFHLAIPAAAVFYALLVWSLPKTISARLTESFSFAGHNPLSDR